MKQLLAPKAAKVLSTAALMLTLLAPTTIHAAGTGDKPAHTADQPTAAQKQALQQKMKLVKEHEAKLAAKEAGGVVIMSDGESKTISVPSYQQEKNYWCGPATVKQILGAVNGSSETQTYYAGKLGTTTDGTDFSLVDNVLNDHQDTNNYVYRDFTSSEYATWKSVMILTIDWGYPAALDLKITPQNMPLYTTTVEGHILNNSGYNLLDSTNKKIRLTDPFDQGGRGVTLGNVWHPFDGVWAANQAHFRKAVIW